MYIKLKQIKLSVIALSLGTLLSLSACTNSTGSVGQTMYFTTGTIIDIEKIEVTKNNSDTLANTGILAAVGAVAGQLIGKDTKGTLIGAGVGAGAGLLGSYLSDRGDGMRLTVKTENGTILLDQPYSCELKVGKEIRMIKQSDGSTQVQVKNSNGYKTVSYDNKCN